MQDFSIDGVSNAMLPKDLTEINTMGQRAELSFYDHQIVNRAYCDSKLLVFAQINKN